MKHILQFLAIFALVPYILISCSKDDEEKEPSIKRTVLIYMSAENNLDDLGFMQKDITEMIIGARNLSSDVALLVYVDRHSSGTKPYIARLDSKGKETVKQYDTDFYSSDPDHMRDIMQYVFSKYRAQSYALVFWGHGDGWFLKNEKEAYAKASTRSYGEDIGRDHGANLSKWMNITTLNDVLASLPHLDYIFFDCCNMQCAEVDYELRNRCDYIIASPAEIPGEGAPYDMIVPLLFADKNTAGRKIVDSYIANCSFDGDASGVPLSVVKTSNLETFAQSTKNAVAKICDKYPNPFDISLDGLIYYYKLYLTHDEPAMIDMRNFMRNYLSPSDFSTWDAVLQQTVVYSVHPSDIRETGKKDWQTISDIDFYDFTMNDANYSGISMFIPQEIYVGVEYPHMNPNITYYQTQWGSIVTFK